MSLRALIAGVAVVCGGAAHAGDLLVARVSHELVELGSDGVTRTRSYQERWTRGQDQIWIERIRPPWAAAPSARDEFDLATAPRWITRGPDGSARLALIDEARHLCYRVKPSEYERVGFSGNWAAEYSLIEPASLKQMKLQRGQYEERRAGEYSRVRWVASLQLPRELETGAVDGRVRSRTKVDLLPTPGGAAPWTSAKDWPERELSDLGD